MRYLIPVAGGIIAMVLITFYVIPVIIVEWKKVFISKKK